MQRASEIGSNYDFHVSQCTVKIRLRRDAET